MKKLNLFIPVFWIVSNLLFAQPTDLLISEYVEGSSNNKALEFYNITGNTIDLNADEYIIEIYFNGSTTVGTTINLTGTVGSSDVYVLADNDADAAILVVTDQISTASFFNGDDAIVLKKGGALGTIIDVIGQVGLDPGTEWGSSLTSTQDNTLRRKGGTTVGDTNPNDAFDPSIEWDGYATDTFDGLGTPGPLPVELTSFSVSAIAPTVKLTWATATEINNYGFEVERKSNVKGQTSDEWTKLGFVNGNGNSNSPKSYSFVDDNVTAGTYGYRLKQIDNDGQFEYSKAIEIGLTAPDRFELSQNYPNPFNPSTTINYNLPEATNVKLIIYNILGQEVKTLVNEFNEAGVHTINFDASDLNSGMYLYKIEAGTFVQTRKMTLVK